MDLRAIRLGIPFALFAAAGCGGSSTEVTPGPAMIRVYAGFAGVTTASSIYINGVLDSGTVPYVSVPSGPVQISVRNPSVTTTVQDTVMIQPGHIYTFFATSPSWLVDETNDQPGNPPAGQALYKFFNSTTTATNLYLFPNGTANAPTEIGVAPGTGESVYYPVPAGSEIIGVGSYLNGEFVGTTATVEFEAGATYSGFFAPTTGASILGTLSPRDVVSHSRPLTQFKP